MRIYLLITVLATACATGGRYDLKTGMTPTEVEKRMGKPIEITSVESHKAYLYRVSIRNLKRDYLTIFDGQQLIAWGPAEEAKLDLLKMKKQQKLETACENTLKAQRKKLLNKSVWFSQVGGCLLPRENPKHLEKLMVKSISSKKDYYNCNYEFELSSKDQTFVFKSNSNDTPKCILTKSDIDKIKSLNSKWKDAIKERTIKKGLPVIALHQIIGIPERVNSDSYGTDQLVYKGNLYIYVKNQKVESWQGNLGNLEPLPWGEPF